MKRATMVKCHRWLGIVMCFFVLAFCISGIILNHRQALASADVSRRWLPALFQYSNWNNGLLRGTFATTADSVLFFGNNGIWAADTAFATATDFNQGLPQGADNRNVKAIAKHRGRLYAATQFGLWKRVGDKWTSVALPGAEGDVRLSDLYCHADTLVAVGRSALHVAAGTDFFRKVTLPGAVGEKPEQSLFRIAFNTHSGQIFGTAGVIAMDALAVALSALAITGIVFFAARKSNAKPQRKAKLLRHSLKLHTRIGACAFALLMFVTVTGWVLRPPALVALVKVRVPMTGSNPWHDKLRAMRYDDLNARWMMSTSDGFYTMPALGAAPRKMEGMPPVSVMGINVWQKADSARWLIGSLSGMYVWHSTTGKAADYFTGEDAPTVAGPPFGSRPIIGYAKDAPIEYYEGSHFAPMPENFKDAPMSLWSVALEVHTGRIYTVLGPLTLVFIFIAGAAMAWLLILGWKLRKKTIAKK